MKKGNSESYENFLKRNCSKCKTCEECNKYAIFKVSVSLGNSKCSRVNEGPNFY